MIVYEHEDAIEATLHFLEEKREAVEGELLIGLMAPRWVLGREDATNLASDMCERRTAATKIIIGHPYPMLGADDQQWIVMLSRDQYRVGFLCGFGDDGEMYFVADVPKEEREKAEALLAPVAA